MKYRMTVLLLLFATFAVSAADEDFKIQLSGWSYSRERKTITGSNRITGNLTLKNTSGGALADVKVTLVFTTGMGEKLGQPISKAVGALKAGETQKVTLVEQQIPVFGGYEVTVEFNGGKEEWFANSDTGQPQPKAGNVKGAASVVVLGREATQDRSGRFTGTVRVKNEGTVEAKGVTITITFFDQKKRTMKEWSSKLGTGTLAAGAEQKIPFTCADAPRNHNGYEINVKCEETSAEQQFSGGDFTNAEDVEIAKYSFKRDPKTKDLQVSAKVRNGFKQPVDAVKLTATFLDGKKKEVKKYVYDVPGQLAPGEIKPIDFTIPAVPAYEAFEPAIAYKKSDAPAAQAGPAKLEGAFKNQPEVEVIFTDALPKDDKSVTLAGAMRNGKNVPVKDVVITVTFLKADESELTVAEKTLTDVVRPGEERNFIMKAASAAGFAKYSFKFKFTELGTK